MRSSNLESGIASLAVVQEFRFNASASTRAIAANHGGHGLQENVQIEPE